MSAIPGILVAVALVITGQLLLKSGMQRVGAIDRARLGSPLALVGQVARQPAVVFGFGIYGLSALLWLYVLAQAELSYAFPFLALAYAGVTAAATLVLKERFTARQWLGLALVMLGVAAVAVSGS
jgi:drug/metabolite transporter (DMT)-like permease